ncbi:MAG: hypothetical protein CSA86_01840 [Arcobacter sp.]|nr:MAG: hypothetical protein CSA86_01840 [Arcobacter sp.]
MNRSLVLVSQKPIVIHIFTLVCKKLHIKLDVLSKVQIDHKVDIIIVDNDFIDDRFDIIKSYAKMTGAISKEELSFSSANDFIVPFPFLPSSLEEILETQLEILKKRENTKTYISNVAVDEMEKTEEVLDPALEYLESLASGIASDIEEENDDSIVPLSTVNNGGVLDTKELSNIQNIIESATNQQKEDFHEEEKEWMDLSSIIDQAIDEINTTDDIDSKFDHNIIKLNLNDFELEELTPLLNKLDQDIIDSLTDGHEINLQIKIGQAHNE